MVRWPEISFRSPSPNCQTKGRNPPSGTPSRRSRRNYAQCGPQLAGLVPLALYGTSRVITSAPPSPGSISSLLLLFLEKQTLSLRRPHSILFERGNHAMSMWERLDSRRVGVYIKGM